MCVVKLCCRIARAGDVQGVVVGGRGGASVHRRVRWLKNLQSLKCFCVSAEYSHKNIIAVKYDTESR